MILQNWWYTTLLRTDEDNQFCDPLQKDIETEFLVIGGGMAGLHAARTLAEAGKQTVLLERNICGGSSTGKSAGFLTPDSELELSQLIRRYGTQNARSIWGVAERGVRLIVDAISSYGISCDLLEQDSLFLGVGRSGASAVAEETESRKEMGFPYTSYTRDSLRTVTSAKGYVGGTRYGGTHGINPLLFAQGLKNALVKKGVQIYESTEVERINGNTAFTHLGSVKAKYIIVCSDKMPAEFAPVASYLYHAQTFLSISEPISKKDIMYLFPEKSMMCWDSKLVYSYYRITGDNRILLGGGSALTTFTPLDVTSPIVIENVIVDFKKRFPELEELKFIQYWPGRIDTTQDIMPIVDYDRGNKTITYVLGCVGLPWAAACGTFAAERYLNPEKSQPYEQFLRMDRKFFFPKVAQRIFGKMITFSLNNAYAKYIQKDSRM